MITCVCLIGSKQIFSKEINQASPMTINKREQAHVHTIYIYNRLVVGTMLPKLDGYKHPVLNEINILETNSI